MTAGGAREQQDIALPLMIPLGMEMFALGKDAPIASESRLLVAG
jgi:hypothetical protein